MEGLLVQNLLGTWSGQGLNLVTRLAATIGGSKLEHNTVINISQVSAISSIVV